MDVPDHEHRPAARCRRPDHQIHAAAGERHLYFTIPDHIFAIDARTGEHIWQYDFQDKGGHLVGQRGVGMYGNWLYFVSPDGWFISLNAKDGKERWRKKIADEKLQYFTTMAPLVVKDHIIVGVGGDAMDVRGYLESRNPETGDLEWRWYTTPVKMGDPGSETWPTQESMDHGGGMTWMPGTYDPELNLLYWGTGNANPFSPDSRVREPTCGPPRLWR
jgi:alcohol dehydrogenase (cytochrome c)